MQQDWRRDPIWQLLGIIISVIIVIVTQFNDPSLKIAIALTGAVVCVWIYLGNKQLARFFSHILVISVLRVLLRIFLFLLCAVLFFLSLALFIGANILWEKIMTGAGCVLILSVGVAVYHNDRPFIANVFTYAGFLTGFIGVALMIVADNLWVKVALGVTSLLIEIVTYIFSTKDIATLSARQKSHPSQNAAEQSIITSSEAHKAIDR